MLVDSHCHLNFPDFKDDLDAVIARARDAGVTVMQTICTGMEEFDEVHGIAQKYEGVYCSVGVHPNESDKAPVIPTVEDLLEKTKLPKVIGIGETGLDYHYLKNAKSDDKNTKNTIKIQKDSFKIHIDAARKSGLPVIVHSRDADEATVDMLTEEMRAGKFKGLIHCFTGTKYLADKAVELGLYISLSGIITFKNAQSIRDALQDVPLDRLLVETDAPYLAPNPHRGKRNEPSFTIYTNKILSEVKKISEEECARVTTENFYRLFDKVSA
jgi:TatD DNase family protein